MRREVILVGPPLSFNPRDILAPPGAATDIDVRTLQKLMWLASW
jgi:hypothetical protein